MIPGPAVRLFCLCLLLVSGQAAVAAQYVQHEGYEIHYTAIPSTLIPADVASLHGITRSENEIVINISAVRDGHSATAAVQGQVINLLNQRSELAFTEVVEADAIYYLASHTAMLEDILQFEVSVQPAEASAVQIRFVRRYD